jgi:hypothetical protein
LVSLPNASLAEQLVIVCARSDPEPDEAVRSFCGERSVAGADTRRPICTDLLELKRWVAGILLEMFVDSICNLLDFGRKRSVASPEVRVSVVL